MSKSILVRDELVAFVEAAAVESHRSPSQKIERWAQIGRVLESTLSHPAESAVKRVGRSGLDAALDQVGVSETIRRTQKIIRSASGGIVSPDSQAAPLFDRTGNEG